MNKKKYYIYFSQLDSSQPVFKNMSSMLIMDTNTDTLKASYITGLWTEIEDKSSDYKLIFLYITNQRFIFLCDTKL